MRKMYLIWGMGMVTKRVINQEIYQEIDYFIDAATAGQTYLGKEIKPENFIDDVDRDNTVIIIAADESFYAVALKLEKKGFTNGIHFFAYFQWNGDGHLPLLISDRRWNDNGYIDHQGLSKSPNTRFQIVNHLIDFNHVESLLDLGEGIYNNQMLLPGHVKYFGVDFVKRNDKTIVCDFNKYEFPNICTEGGMADVVCLLGVYEWANDARWLLRRAAEAVNEGGLFFTTCFYPGYIKEFTGYGRNWCNFFFQHELVLLLKGFGLELTDGRDISLQHAVLKFIKTC